VQVSDHGAREGRVPEEVFGCGEYFVSYCEHTRILSDPADRNRVHHPIVFMILWRGSAPCQLAAGSGTGTAQRHGRRRRRGGRGAFFCLFPF
jgi:hypothetical protein